MTPSLHSVYWSHWPGSATRYTPGPVQSSFPGELLALSSLMSWTAGASGIVSDLKLAEVFEFFPKFKPILGQDFILFLRTGGSHKRTKMHFRKHSKYSDYFDDAKQLSTALGW